MKAFLLLTALNAQAAEAVRLSVEELPRLVADQNGTARGSLLQAQSAEKRLGFLSRSRLPTVELTAGEERFQTGGYSWRSEPYGSVEATANLYNGGRDSLQERTRRGQTTAARAAAEKALADDLYEARRSYWELVSSSELLSVFKEAAEINEKHAQLAERRIKAGLATEADRLEFSVQRSVLREEIESLDHERTIISIALAGRLGFPKGTAFSVSTAVPHDHDEELFGKTGPSPLVVSLKSLEAAAATHRTAASRWWAPSVDAYAGYSLYTLREREYLVRSQRDDGAFGLRLNLPLFDGLRSRAEAQEHALLERGYALKAQQAAAAHEAEIGQAEEELHHLHELVHNGEERIAQGSRYLSVILDEYGRGIKNSADVLGASERLLFFRRQAVERRRDYMTTKAWLLRLLGI